MKAPEFWDRDGWPARLLTPLSVLYAWAGRRRFAQAQPVRAPVPVICIGNITAGGTGKTPICLSVAERLRVLGHSPHLLTRGYGGTEAGPRLVDPIRHTAARVGDEALLLANAAPTWVARWRPDGAQAAAQMGADVVVMDDGFQNPHLIKDLSLLVVDGGQGFGNGRIIPAGPCREAIGPALARAQAVVLMGDDRHGILPRLTAMSPAPVLRARLEPGAEAARFQGREVVAFAGIGRPEKFFTTLRQCGATLIAAKAFPDHHPYGTGELDDLLRLADRTGALLATTAKDAVRTPAALRPRLDVLTVRAHWSDVPALDGILAAIDPSRSRS